MTLQKKYTILFAEVHRICCNKQKSIGVNNTALCAMARAGDILA